MKKLKLFDHWGKKFNTFIVIFKHVCNVCKWWVFTIHMIYVLKLSSCTHKHSLISLVRNTCDKFYVILLVKMPVPKLYANKWEISSTTLSNCTATFTCVVKMHSHFQIVVLCLSICNQKKTTKNPPKLDHNSTQFTCILYCAISCSSIPTIRSYLNFYPWVKIC